jgi:peptidoglycan/LPS O-acetylase OafA/YrhL
VPLVTHGWGESVERHGGHGGITYQPALDGLRALAVAAVIAYHFGAGWASGGFLGVDAFFVLSGYLITSLLLTEWGRDGRISLAGFWVRRARRLLPALLVVLGVVALYAAALAPASQLNTLRSDGIASLFYFANWHFVLSGQSYFDLFALPSPMRHLWSLAIEEQFYLVWPLVVLVCLRVGRGSRKVLAGVCVAGIAASVTVMAMLYEPADPSRAYYGTDARAHTLLVGAVLALVLMRRRPARRGSVMALHTAGLVAAGACVWAWASASDQGAELYHGGSFAFSVAVAVVVASAVQPGRRSVWSPLRAVLSLGALRWVGLISYGLYLWHWPATVILTETRTGVSGAALTVLRLTVTVVAATLSFYLVEQPIRRGALRGWRGRIAVPAGFATVGVVVLVATVGATAATPLASVRAGQKLAAAPAPAAAEPDSVASRSVVATGPSRIVVVGDSVPYTLLPGIRAVAADRGVTVDTALVAGCGVVGGIAAYADGRVPPHATECEQRVGDYEQSTLDRTRPDVVVWMSTWETYDRVVGGERIRFGSRAWDDMMLAKIDQAAARLTAGGAHLVITTMAPRAPNELMSSDAAAAETARYVRLNKLYTQYAGAHPATVSVVDFAGVVCPGGPPCPRTVDGLDPRPLDGLHFTPETAGWAARWLLDAVLACRPATAGWLCPSQHFTGTGSHAARK